MDSSQYNEIKLMNELSWLIALFERDCQLNTTDRYNRLRDRSEPISELARLNQMRSIGIWSFAAG